MKQIGILYVGKEMQLCLNEETYEFCCVDKEKITTFGPEEAIMYLCKPWNEINTYKDEKGIHYVSYIYDGIYIDIWADDVKGLLNLICEMLSPSEDMEGWILDKLEKEK